MRTRLTFALKVDEKVAAETLLASAHLLEPIRDESLQWNSLKDLASVLKARGDAQQASFNQATTAANGLTDPDEKAQALAQAQSLQETIAAKSLRAELDQINGEGLSKHIYDKYLQPHLPQFLYFDEYYQMRGCENIETLQQRIEKSQLFPSDHPIIGLIELAGLKLARAGEPKPDAGAEKQATGRKQPSDQQNPEVLVAEQAPPPGVRRAAR